MKCLRTYLVLALLLTVIFGCGTSEDPEPDADVMQLGTIRGEVESIDGVTIQVRLLKDGQQVAQAEADTTYEFADLESGKYTVQITAKGHEKIETNVTVEAGQVFQLDKAGLVVSVEVELDEGEGIKLGTLAPDFELTASNNNKYKLSETLKSKNVVIVFYRGDF